MTTTSINDITVDLHNLYNAYSAVLDQAKSQLESIALSDDDIQRLADKVLHNPSVTARVVDHLLDRLDDRPIDDLLDTNRFVGRVAERIMIHIQSDVTREIRSYTHSDDFKRELNRLAANCALADDDLTSPINMLLRQRLRRAMTYAFAGEAVDQAFNELDSPANA